MERRDFLKTTGVGLGATALGLTLPGCVGDDGSSGTDEPGSAGAVGGDFTFAHITDTHIQPELKAADGCRMCFEQVTRQEPDFAILGGDLVFDVNQTPPPRATQLFDLYDVALESLELPVHHVVGNHDVYGIRTGSGVSPDDPLYGKKMYEDRIGARYHGFDHKGWRFIMLDSIAIRRAEGRAYWGEIDPEQMEWLAETLRDAGPRMPIVVATHIPLHTAFWSLVDGPNSAPPASVVTRNAREVMELLGSYNVKAVLQGHTHIREVIDYHGCQYITSGAVCGDWWKGERMGHPEGYALLECRGGEVGWSYHTYGFEAVSEG